MLGELPFRIGKLMSCTIHHQPVRLSWPIRLVWPGKPVASQGHLPGEVIEPSPVATDEGKGFVAECIS